MDIDVGYLAGLIDGDGYIMVYPDGSRYPQIVITSGNKGFLELLRNKIGSGGIYKTKSENDETIKRESGKYECDPLYRYMISEKEVVRNLLEEMIPYLVLKKNIASKALTEIERLVK